VTARILIIVKSKLCHQGSANGTPGTHEHYSGVRKRTACASSNRVVVFKRVSKL